MALPQGLMDIAYLIDEVVMQNLSLYGCLKNADPMVQHLVKTSPHPLMRFRRDWMRREALRQCLEATRTQGKMNEQVAAEPKRGSIRREACIDPWLAGDMRQRHKTSWNDPDFRRWVKREEPKVFPK